MNFHQVFLLTAALYFYIYIFIFSLLFNLLLLSGLFMYSFSVFISKYWYCCLKSCLCYSLLILLLSTKVMTSFGWKTFHAGLGHHLKKSNLIWLKQLQARCIHQVRGWQRSPLTGFCIPSPVLGAIPERCLCRDLELDCDGGQLPEIPVVAVNVTMMWVRNLCFVFLQYPEAEAASSSSGLTLQRTSVKASKHFIKDRVKWHRGDWVCKPDV